MGAGAGGGCWGRRWVLGRAVGAGAGGGCWGRRWVPGPAPRHPAPAAPPLQGRERMGPCPRGWLDFGGHCYGYFGQELTWRQAEVGAGGSSRGGCHLASLHTPEEHRALAAFIARRQRREEEEEENVWIGLYHRSQAWMWVDGSQTRYSAWEGDDPPKRKHCAALDDSSGFMSWEDESCGERKPFVCKYAA
uniref:C-type lectin domain-containing protein n=1 Tax=Aquila chrysaetos chrysaetos TaxID=223781 RepID=A0A663E250_AQUCH